MAGRQEIFGFGKKKKELERMAEEHREKRKKALEISGRYYEDVMQARRDIVEAWKKGGYINR